ncbi:hypothetical protein BZG36_02433 [Bifiguratus adelaidae]|uniref:alpha-1,2-Mannosidase n=1 Tax=Bifiguratus adelaidae TaxID=1938954 RepID=A0A261Y3Q8_9FUNG|nr:hypothetical protein BZG36_02433 [Bifiguratus adelaidae]
MLLVHSNKEDAVAKWRQSAGRYNAGADADAVRDGENNEVIQHKTDAAIPGAGSRYHGVPVPDYQPPDTIEDEVDREIEHELFDHDKPKDAWKQDAGPITPSPFLFHQTPPPASLWSSEPLWAERQQAVVAAFKDSWRSYAEHAFGQDEYHPIAHKGETWIDGGIGLMIIDSLDTMLLMNLTDEYNQARRWIERDLDYSKTGQVNLFETTIRVVGGLLSAYHLSGNDDLYLKKADDLASRLLVAFETPTGLPWANAKLFGTKLPSSYFDPNPTSTAEATTVQMEFKYLAHLTGKKEYWDKAETVMKIITDRVKGGNSLEGLLPILMNPQTGYFQGHEIRLGSRGDSYYEYLLKQYLQTARTEPVYRAMYDQAVAAIKKYLIGYSHPNNLLFLGELPYGANQPDKLSNKMDHLVCFMGGNLALGATEGLPVSEAMAQLTRSDLEDVKIGAELTRTCYETYNVTASGLAPEIVYFRVKDGYSKPDDGTGYQQDIEIRPNDAHNLLRPETVESLFLMYRLTGDRQYREWGWKIFSNFVKHARLPDGGYSALNDVTVSPPPRRDKMDTFWLAETLKYLYLLFGPQDLIPLDRYVFNTEAHPLPVFTPKIVDPGANWSQYVRGLATATPYKDLCNSSTTLSTYFHLSPSCDERSSTYSIHDFLLFPTFLSKDEQYLLLEACNRKLKRSLGKGAPYERGHFDGVIRGYKECVVSDWQKDAVRVQPLIDRVKSLFPKDTHWDVPHILDLSKHGEILAHIDNVEYSGSIVAGLSLGSPAIMTLRHKDDAKCWFEVWLEPGSLYIQRYA